MFKSKQEFIGDKGWMDEHRDKERKKRVSKWIRDIKVAWNERKKNCTKELIFESCKNIKIDGNYMEG